jgi:hypothetical protein
MDSHSYNFSEEIIKSRIKTINIILLIVGSFVIILYLISAYFIKLNFLIVIPAILLTIFISVLIIIIMYKALFKSFKDIKIIINDKCIERNGININEKIEFNDIKKVKIIKLKNDKILGLKVISKNNIFVIGGFEKIDEIAEKINNKVENNIIEVSTRKSDPTNIKSIILSAFLGLLIYIIIILLIIFIPIIFKLNNRIYITNILDKSIMIIIGISLFIIKPLSKRLGKKYKIFEIIISLFLILGAIAQIFLQ